ncbi:hypothetical protein BDZ88DRAFT_270731 [Geranomyces variabilis]|nr:hypothetical protein BDZ88DRAFT_270731 [Geranomyces variabilis]
MLRSRRRGSPCRRNAERKGSETSPRVEPLFWAHVKCAVCAAPSLKFPLLPLFLRPLLLHLLRLLSFGSIPPFIPIGQPLSHMPYYSLFLAEAPDVRIGAWQVARPPTAHQLREWVVIVFPQVAALPTDRTAAAAQLFDRHTHAPFSPADPMPNQHCDFYIKLSSAELGERSRGVIPSSATTTPSASGQSTPVGSHFLKRKHEPRDLKTDRATFQPLLKQLTMIRDGGCIVTGNPFPSSLQCSHIIPPAIANDWFNARPASLRSLTPTVARKTGAPDYTAGYDVRNALTLTQVLHSGFDAYKWGIITEANQILRMAQSGFLLGACSQEQRRITRTSSQTRRFSAFILRSACAEIFAPKGRGLPSPSTLRSVPRIRWEPVTRRPMSGRATGAAWICRPSRAKRFGVEC